MEPERIDDLYKWTTNDDDYVNSIAEGVLSWRGINACSSDSDEGLDNWKHQLHEVFSRRCACITKKLRWIGSEICEFPAFDGEGSMETFLTQYKEVVGEP